MTDEQSQLEKKQVMKDAATLFERAKTETGSELGGRFKHLSKTTITGASAVPQQPRHATYAKDDNLEAPLGYSVHSVPDLEHT